jgi:extracellular factor (EF) 3-hydroxypalmitic acid methyl ester biosynthesis protein
VLLYEWVAPGGLLLTTNVDATLNDLRSFRHSLDFVLDWQLIYRRSSQFSALVPNSINAESSVKSDETGINLFLELRKPNNG